MRRINTNTRDTMEDGKYEIVVNDGKELKELVGQIKTVIDKIRTEQDTPPIEQIVSQFIIVEKDTGKEYDGSGFPIEGKYVLNKGKMTKNLNAKSLYDAIQYLYEVAEKEYEWLRMLREGVNPDDVINEYSITDTKTTKTYDHFGLE